MELGALKKIMDYWQNEYDWQTQEGLINQFHQYTMEIDDMNIHFVHMQAKRPTAVPLLLLHGYLPKTLRSACLRIRYLERIWRRPALGLWQEA